LQSGVVDEFAEGERLDVEDGELIAEGGGRKRQEGVKVVLEAEQQGWVRGELQQQERGGARAGGGRRAVAIQPYQQKY
jgi:hypothetical protein